MANNSSTITLQKIAGDCIKSVRSLVPPENEEEAVDTWRPERT